MIGIININKPSGMSSNKAVVIIKKTVHEDKVGHLGTLDPLASGVLPICIGKATRLFDYYLNKTKQYRATFTFGYETDTLDSEGRVINKSDVIPTHSQIIDKLKCFVGDIEQVPPQYSAKSINGVRAYNLARQGIEVALKSKKIHIYSYECVGQSNENSFEFLIECSAGTYIRSLCRDLAHSLDTYATMTRLIRTRCGAFDISKAITIEDIDKAIIEDNLITVDEAILLPTITLDACQYDDVIHGRRCLWDSEGEYKVLYDNTVIGIGKVTDGLLKIITNLRV